MLEELQKELDTISYPNNYHYNIVTLEPKGSLIKRIEKLRLYAPQLFEKVDSFLDVGSSLGYFLCYHANQDCKRVEGLDKDIKQNAITRRVAQTKEYKQIKVTDTTFRLFATDKQFELIFLGNIFHYIHRESGWDIVMKLAGLCSGHCIIEAPTDHEYFKKYYTDVQPKDYTYEQFLLQFGKYFDLVSEGNSFCADRKILVFKRKNNNYAKFIDITTLDFSSLKMTEKIGNKFVKKTYLDHNNKCKYKIHDGFYNGFPLSAYISSLDNDVADFHYHIIDKDKVVGYCSEYVNGTYCADKKELFSSILTLMIKSINCGLLPWDYGYVNFIKGEDAIKYIDLDYYSWVADLDRTKTPNVCTKFVLRTVSGGCSPLPIELKTPEFIDSFIQNLTNIEFLKGLK